MASKPPKRSKPQQKFDAKQFLTSAGAGRRSVMYEAGEQIFRQGDPATAVYYIENGSVQVSVLSDQGKEGVIGTLSAGDFVGEGCLTGQESYLASVHANQPTTAIAIDRSVMMRVLREQPKLSEMFTSFLLTRNIQIEADLVDQLFNSSEKRLARVLLLLANFGKEGKLEAIVPKVSQDTLAARVGTTRSRVNFFMNKFRRLGLIEYNGKIKVHSALINVIVHD